MMIVGRTLYTLTVTAPKGKLAIKDARRFLDSFVVTPAGRNPTLPRRRSAERQIEGIQIVASESE